MEDIAFIITCAILFGLISTFILIYFKRLKEASSEYKRAKNVIDEIIVSFNRDLQKQNEMIQEIARRYERTLVERDNKISELNTIALEIRNRIKELIDYKNDLSANQEDLKVKIDELYMKYDEILRKINEIERKRTERTGVEEKIDISGAEIPHPAPKTMENRALTPLTETELKVLEILAREGEKTVPEIRDKIGLTREHTARLMKSLYTRGYVERLSNRIPYVYRLNREMEEILRRENMRP